jgi:CRP-like cAMP-binding protein
MEPTFWADQIDAHRLLVQISTGRSTADYKDNQKIYSQGEDANFVFFVQDGSVSITATSAQGVESSLGIARAGQFFGEACLYDVPVRVASARALGNCRITSVTKGAMLGTIYGQPRFARMFIDYLSAHNSWVRSAMLDHLLSPADAPASLTG